MLAKIHKSQPIITNAKNVLMNVNKYKQMLLNRYKC